MEAKEEEINKEKSQKERLENNPAFQNEEAAIKDKATPVEFPIPIDLIDDLKKDKIDPLTEGRETNLGYDEKSPRKKELEQEEHYDQEDK